MNVLEVTVSELQSAASKIAAQNEAFRDALAALQNANSALCDGWTGSAHEDFVSNMEQRFNWYNQMASLVDEYVKMMNDTATRYQETDRDAVSKIRNK